MRASAYKARRILSLVLVAMPWAAAALADPAIDLGKAREDLVGSGSRQWVKERVVVSMGGKKVCTAGEAYNFHSNGSVDIVLCANQVLTRRNVPWTLQPAPPLDVRLVFDGRRYQLSFGGNARAPQMRWRQLGRAKPDPTTDIFLGLSKD